MFKLYCSLNENRHSVNKGKITSGARQTQVTAFRLVPVAAAAQRSDGRHIPANSSTGEVSFIISSPFVAKITPSSSSFELLNTKMSSVTKCNKWRVNF